MAVTKEQKQIYALAAIIVIMIGALGYYFRDKFLPAAQPGAEAGSQIQRMTLPGQTASQLFGRDDYKSLQRFGKVPVVPTGLGTKNPFRSEQTP